MCNCATSEARSGATNIVAHHEVERMDRHDVEKVLDHHHHVVVVSVLANHTVQRAEAPSFWTSHSTEVLSIAAEQIAAATSAP